MRKMARREISRVLTAEGEEGEGVGVGERGEEERRGPIKFGARTLSARLHLFLDFPETLPSTFSVRINDLARMRITRRRGDRHTKTDEKRRQIDKEIEREREEEKKRRGEKVRRDSTHPRPVAAPRE